MGAFTLHNSRLVRTVVISTAVLAGSVTGLVGVGGAGATMPCVERDVAGLAGGALVDGDMLMPCDEIEVIGASGGDASGDGDVPPTQNELSIWLIESKEVQNVELADGEAAGVALTAERWAILLLEGKQAQNEVVADGQGEVARPPHLSQPY